MGELGPVAMPGGNGDCCQVWMVVVCQSPGFLFCAQPEMAVAKRQTVRVIQSRVVRMNSLFQARKKHTPRANLLYVSSQVERKRKIHGKRRLWRFPGSLALVKAQEGLNRLA